MKIISVCPESFAANTYILLSGNKAFVVDPAVSVSALERALLRENAELVGILLTHGHFDHTISADTVREYFSVPLMMHEKDAPMMTNGRINGFFDFYGKESVHKPAEKLLSGGEVLTLGAEQLEVISTPGHSPGSVCFLCPESSDSGNGFFLITGDTLFGDSIGRCDLWGGDDEQMRCSLSLLSLLDGSMRIYPGHGPMANIIMALNNARCYVDF